VTDHPALTVRTGWSERLDRTFETIKGVQHTLVFNAKALVVLISATIAGLISRLPDEPNVVCPFDLRLTHDVVDDAHWIDLRI
jgi:hypothetical protein